MLDSKEEKPIKVLDFA